MQRLWAVLAVLGLLAGCEVAPQRQLPVQAPRDSMQTGGNLPPRQAAQNFVAAVVAVEPVAEAYCRARTQGVPCDFQIVVDDRQNQPPNAFQTVDRQGRPVIGFTLALIADARNVDEIAFVLGHETAHHILGHLPRQRQSATTGAVLAGVLVALGGGSSNAVQSAQEVGASVGARRYSKGFELEADALGAEIALRAGLDPVRGAQFFARIPDPGDAFLGTHPPNADRMATVRAAVSRLR